MKFRNYKNNDGLQILLPQVIFDQITELVSMHYPNECGGVFIGKIDGEKAIIDQLLLPKIVKSSPTKFRRFASDINQRLEEIHKENEEKIIYLGEWHSHPNGLPIPSPTDLGTMISISESTKIKIKTPILLVVGYQPDPPFYNEKFYFTYKQELIPYERI